LKYGFIFDLDGTLVDSCEQIGRSINFVRNQNGHSALSDAAVSNFVGLPATELIRDLNLSESEEVKLIIEFRKVLKQEIEKQNNCYFDALSFVQSLKRLEIPMALATSKPEDLAKLVIQNSDYCGFIELIVGTGLHEPKPHPGMILHAVELMNSSGAVMFGDRPEDMIAAKRAGITAVGIAQTSFSKSDLIMSGADRTFNNFSEILVDIKRSGGNPIEFFF